MDAVAGGKTKDMLVATGLSAERAAVVCGGGIPAAPQEEAPSEARPATSDYAVSDIARNASS